MAAYATVISLKHTINHLLNSSQISFVSLSREIIESANNALQSLRKTLIKLDKSSKSSSRKKINALDHQIREVVCELEDVLESHVSKQILSQSEEEISGDGFQFSIDLQETEHEIKCLVETLKEMEQNYINELDSPEFQEDGEEVSVYSRIDSSGNESKVVGFSDKYLEIKDRLKRVSGNYAVTPITGMAGIGKTTVANKIFNDLDVSQHFDVRAWVTVGRKWQLKDILRAILVQVDSDAPGMIMEEEERNIGDYLKERLKGKRHLIVLDDVWDKQVWNELNSLLGDDKNGRKILITTRLDQVGRGASNPVSGIVKMRLLNVEESWDLLREKVFGDEICPYELQKIGRKIAANCEGLPLMIVAVASLLSQEERKPEFWNEVAEKKNSVFMDAYGAISKVLFSSLDYLAQVLRPFFLYMGVFPRNYEISKSKLVTLWAVEGFPEPLRWQTANDYSEQCLRALIHNNLVLLNRECTIWNMSSTGVKSCNVHITIWHLCSEEAKKNKFFHILDRCGDDLEDGIESQRRLCIHNNVLLSLEHVHNLMAEHCASTARSLLCFGPYCQYQLPLCFGLRLLRVLDALTIRFYEFPIEVLDLIQLRYLALTSSGELPSSISRLWSLQFLIVFRHVSMKSSTTSYMPKEIWDMKELKHLQIVGSDLQDPCGASLPKLSTLLNVSVLSCTEAILEAIPNLKKLGIQIESDPDGDEPLSCFDQICNLNRLRILKCVVMNPELMSGVVTLDPLPLPTFPSVLKKLHLSGLGYPWEYASVIGSLPHLEVLKLRCYAFQGPVWIVEEKIFPKLGYLVIEDSDLVQWEVKDGGCPNLHSLSIIHCYLLEKIHGELGLNFGKVKVVDSNPLAGICLNKIIDAHSQMEFYDPRISVNSSWDDKKLKS